MTEPEAAGDPVGRQAEPASARTSTDWWEVAAAVLLSLATLASAFSGYQASRWNGEQTQANRAAGAARTESTRQSNVANRQILVDLTAFTAWADAVGAGDARLADFYLERLRPELAAAVETWRDGAPVGEIPPGSPFDSDTYELAANLEADRLLAVAEAEVAHADVAAQRADNFVLTAVMYASVLFFAGIASKMRGRLASRIAVGLAGGMFMLASSVLVTLPWNIGV